MCVESDVTCIPFLLIMILDFQYITQRSVESNVMHFKFYHSILLHLVLKKELE